MSLIGSLKRNSLTKKITRKDAEKAMSKWLIGTGEETVQRRHVEESKTCKSQNKKDVNDRDSAQCFFYTLLFIFFTVLAVFIIMV